MPENNMKLQYNFHSMPKRFMVWDKQNKTFLTQPLEIWQIVIHFCNRVSDLVDDNLQENRYILCQSTNLFDKDSNEIFEGSIVRSRNKTYVIEQLDGCWMGYDVKTHKVFPLWKLELPLEVFGHILSSPELLD